MGWNVRHGQRWPAAARWVLLAAVLAGVFSMHVLTAEHGTNRHSMLPVASIASHDVLGGHDVMSVDATPIGTISVMPGSTFVVGDGQTTPGNPGPGVEHGAMASCVLFLVIGSAALILALLHHRRFAGPPGIGGLTGAALADMRRRGPPGRWTRFALCVIRV